PVLPNTIYPLQNERPSSLSGFLRYCLSLRYRASGLFSERLSPCRPPQRMRSFQFLRALLFSFSFFGLDLLAHLQPQLLLPITIVLALVEFGIVNNSLL